MIPIGHFFFRYRNYLFILFYAALFLPSPDLFSPDQLGPSYYYWPIILGVTITVSGQLIRGATIGLAYILRGGREGRPYADGLVTEGIFRHCRNPLYVGNILMLLGVGILANSLIYVVIVIPVFLFIYQAIVLAEEDFLRKKFGEGYDRYCRDVSRWWPRFKGLRQTFKSMRFNWRRWVLREHGTQFIWLAGITLLLFLNYPQLTDYDTERRNWLMGSILAALLLVYLLIRFLKKTGRFRDQP